ncbi:cobaltochelatase subunit CobN [Azospirillum halopraeferens]|uniref:cobaltochelatase subunit CobN n=1 Tax=Azospirillum halopraeferens TaxID=34010 RepID=UPI000428A3E9|nr:cobaltochelatase subunit CobN [Azospirillum halopraeferens]
MLRFCLSLLVLLLAMAEPAAARSVLFLYTPPVQPGKFQRMEPLAQAAGVIVAHRAVDDLNLETAAAELQAYDLVIVDAPYGMTLQSARAKLSPVLGAVSTPWLWVRNDGYEERGLGAGPAERLVPYYRNGGRWNVAGLFCQLNAGVFAPPAAAGDLLAPLARLWSGAEAGCPAARVFPDSAIYHPEYEDGVFPDLSAYLAWRGVDPAAGRQAVGILFHQAYMAAGLTGFLDDMIRRIEAAGAVAVPVYTPAMENGAITRLVTLPGTGRPFTDALINTQILLNPEGRKAEFEALGVPVLQAMPYRKGEEADWRADPVGLTPTDVPFYLAQPEYAGVIDPLIAAYTRERDGDIVAMDAQAQAVVNKAAALLRLRRLAPAERRTAFLYWNYPPGETNLGASFLNLPRSLATVLEAMAGQGYAVETPDDEALTASMKALLAPYYREGRLADLLDAGLAETLPLARYRQWFNALPAAVREPVTQRFGPPESSAMATVIDGEAVFVVPRLALGNAVILPQPPRGEASDDREKALYHDTRVPPSHFYLAAYLWVREGFGADALVHFGTHGTQEWQPGKERGLAVTDYPYLVLGDTPVLYPYIVDNIGEATQTKRRGRAVVISHNTPSFAPAGLHGEINRLHDLLHTWINMDEGEVKAKTAAEIRAVAVAENLHSDMGWDAARIDADFRGFVDALHVILHDLALHNQPLGLATFGAPAEPDLRLFTVMQMLGCPFLKALMPDDPEEMVVADYSLLKETPAWTLLERHVRAGEPYDGGDAALADLLETARSHWRALGENREIAGLLAGLEGRHVPTGYGGDPIRNPESLPTGRNLYPFDPSRVPTKQAWEAGREAAEKLIAQHRDTHGAYPDKLAFTLWSVETMRQFGVLEAQALAAMGFRPVWNAGERVVGVEPIPAAELKRPRVDAVISATGLYRDHFPQVMKLLAEAARLGGELDEPDNPIAANTRAVEAALLGRGVAAADARRLAQTRVFSSESGAYGTGLDDATLATDTWGRTADGREDRREADAKLATLYLSRMQFAYGPDESTWGEKPPVNAYAEHLKGVDGALLSRSSNLYGMLTTDDPFQYLGGLSLAVRHLSGTSPELYIANLREAGNPRVDSAAGFLATELKARYFHPNWIAQMQKEGYSGTLEILGTVNNLWGWQAVAPETVRDDQWNEVKAVFVDDKHGLGVREWFEAHNPAAQAQIIERMLEAARKEYWQADPADVAALAQRWKELADAHDVRSENALFRDFVEAAAAPGFGLAAAAAAAQAAAADAAPAAPAETVQGQRLELQETAAEPVPFDAFALWSLLGTLGLLGAAFAAGVVHQAARRPVTT